MKRSPIFPTSQELFVLVRRVADDQLKPQKPSDADLGRMIGLESSRTSRWKHGQISVTDAARILALAQSLSIDVNILTAVAAGYLSAAEALELMGKDKDFLRFLGEQVLLPRDGGTLTLIGADGSEARVVRRSINKYERPFRRSGSTRPLAKKDREQVVLLADDDEATLEVFTNLTGKGTGLVGVTARNATDALITAGQYHPRLAIIDLFLGGADGFEVVRSIARHKATTATEIIATSLHLTAEVVRKAKGCGATEVLERPLRARPLGKLLRIL